tara:strand:+ start:6566 stop:7411 length:846 start_codon:yes stop_codon:yes gene_type:complete
MAEPKEIKKKGMGKDKGSRKFENTSAADRKKANADGKFGYFDEANRRYVPAFIDMIDGGDRDGRGDEFAGGPLSQILNNIGISPYGSQRERAFGGPTTSPIQQAVAGGPVRPRIRPTQTMPDEVSGVPFNNTPPVMPDEVSGVPFNNTPNPFAGPTYDMPMARSDNSMQFGQQPAGSMPSMSFGQQPAGSMPADPSGVTTQDMALADLQRRIDAVRQAGGTEEDMAPLLRLYSERIALLDPAMYGPNANEARLGPSAMNQVYNYLLPPTTLDGPMYKGFRP